ncbi:MAG: insulinase family protein [Magnetococcales bacterium]|nr:insulinase family protein [Magnetococcales bacterium]
MKRWIAFWLVWMAWTGPGLLHAATSLGEARSFQTRGGIRVFLVENHANPMVEINLLTRGGSAFDPKGRDGVAYLTAWMFNEGAGGMDSETFRARLDDRGIQMDGNANRDTLEVNLTTLSEHLEEAVHLLALAVTEPRFDPKDFARGQQECIANAKQNREQAEWLAGGRLNAMMFAGHPYAHPPTGTEEPLARITLNDVRQFHVKSFRAPQMVLAVAGDVTPSALESLLERYLGGVDSRPSPHGAIPETPSAKVGEAVHLTMESPQTAIQMGRVAMDREDADYYPMLVLNQLLGGPGLTSRLNQEIREKRGLTYGVHSQFSPLEMKGPFMVMMNTKTESVAEALGLIREQMRIVVREGVGEEELTDVKRYLVQSFPLNLDTLKKQAATWSLIGYYRRGVDYLRRWPERVEGVRREDVARVARRMLDPDHYFTVTVGKRAEKK